MRTRRGPALLALALCALARPAAAQDLLPRTPLELRAAPATAPAAYQHTPLPTYPAEARARGLEGVVVLNVEVLRSGRVGEVAIVGSSGAPLLDEAARAAVLRWTFIPARRAGRAVDSVVEVPVRFSLRGDGG